MEHINYETAISTLLQANQGVLPKLDTTVWVALTSVVPGPPAHLTVAELLALALAEIGAEAALAEPVLASPAPARRKLKLPANLHYQGGPVVLTELLEWAVESVN
ncbi:MAG: hypothetical protein ACRYFK_03095 [Janthinobacterium lividum]